MNLPRLIGHRGLCSVAPENTLESFHAAKQAGLDWIECDVQLSLDNKLIIIHDDNLLRTANIKKKIKNLNLLELKKYQPSIPTLKQTLDYCEKINLSINLEIKSQDSAEYLLDFLLKNKFKNNLLISSYFLESLDIFKNKNFNLGLLIDSFKNSDLKWAEKLNTNIIILDNKKININQIGFIQQNNYKILVHTVNNKNRALELFELGVDTIFTDKLTSEDIA